MRIIAMLTYKSQDTPVKYIIYKDNLIVPEPKPANTFVTDINHLHCDYVNLSEDDLINLLDLIANGYF